MSVRREFEDPLFARLHRLAGFSPFKFQVEVLLRERFVSESGAALPKGLDALGKLLPPGHRLLLQGRGCGRCRGFAKIGRAFKFDII
jgi:hypothetical protein